MESNNECNLTSISGLIELRSHAVGEMVSILFFVGGKKVGALRITVDQWHATSLQWHEDVVSLIAMHVQVLKRPE